MFTIEFHVSKQYIQYTSCILDIFIKESWVYCVYTQAIFEGQYITIVFVMDGSCLRWEPEFYTFSVLIFPLPTAPHIATTTVNFIEWSII